MILVVGATGMLGSVIARKLLAGGDEVRVLVREGSDHRGLDVAGAALVFGDLKDRASLDAACGGVGTVITTANSVLRGGDDTLQSVEIMGNRNLVDAAVAAGVDHFVFTSTIGADASSPVPLLQAKGEAEEYAKGSGLTYTILEPNLYMDVWVEMAVGRPARAGDPVTLVGEGSRRHSFIAIQDVADFVVAAVRNDRGRNTTLFLGGPAAVSWRDVVAGYESVLGRTLEVRSLPLGSAVPGLVPVMSDMMTALETYDSPMDTADLAEAYGVTQTSVEDYARTSH